MIRNRIDCSHDLHCRSDGGQMDLSSDPGVLTAAHGLETQEQDFDSVGEVGGRHDNRAFSKGGR